MFSPFALCMNISSDLLQTSCGQECNIYVLYINPWKVVSSYLLTWKAHKTTLVHAIAFQAI